MGFCIERRAERRSVAPRSSIIGSLVNTGDSSSSTGINDVDDQLLVGPGFDGCIGVAFALRSNITQKYVTVGGIFDRNCFQVTAERAEDAAVFTIVPMPGTST